MSITAKYNRRKNCRRSPGNGYRDILIDAKPDYITVKMGNSVFYIRTMQLISVMPD
ncbi:DUF2642 domain-containing protein [Terribacillus aidingensis]|uniref:DUF2642 domain-containing protein n=1 Tax=Terribacillus aidingensis TaxID=586416 RepID=UPI000BE4145F